MRSLFLAFLLLAVTITVGAQSDSSLLPDTGSIAGWQRDGKAKIYPGSDLYGYIDGGAEIFFEYGFRVVTIQLYREGEDRFGVELYRMNDPVAALGIYLTRCGQETPNSSFSERHTAGRHQLVFVRGSFFVIIDNLTGKPEHAETLVVFAKAVAEKLPPSPQSKVFDLLPTSGRVKGSERIIRGPLALQSIITLGDGDVLQLGPTGTAIAASYSNGGGDTSQLIISSYPDSETAAKVFSSLTAHLDSEITVIERNADRVVFRDYSSKFGDIHLVDTRLLIRTSLLTKP